MQDGPVGKPDKLVFRPRHAAPSGSRSRSHRSGWHWLLLLPIAVPLITPMFNRIEPRLFGFPFFYWCQLGFVVLGMGVTATVRRLAGRERR